MTDFPSLSNEQRTGVAREWERFQQGLPVDDTIVRPMILRSWNRCREARFPGRNLTLCPIDSSALETSIARNTDLVESAKLLMDKLVLSIHMSNSVVTLVDRDGLVLHVSATTRDLDNVPYGVPGRHCDEAVLGTNGMGLCVIEERPVYVIASEHFNTALHYLSCAAAPILDVSGRLLGALNLAISTENFHQHTLGLVEAAAHAIEEQIRLRSLISQQHVILELLDDGVIVIESDGTILAINRQACDMLQVDSAVKGKNIRQFGRSSDAIVLALRQRQTFHDRETSISLGNGTLQCALSCAPFTENGGIILTLRETRRMRKYAAKVAGSKAVYTFSDIVGESKAMRDAVGLARIASQNDATTLILGESGTGKELFARSIHNASPRAKGPFVVVNCGALPRTLVQSELFGYVSGAFSGALKEGSPGKFELADGGTIFLDEIGEMPLEAQVSLLRLLQESEVTRLGGKQARRIDVRIIAATNKDLAEAVKRDAFRGDLYYRLNVLSVTVPALRDRGDDIFKLIRVFLDKFQSNSGRHIEISGEAMAALAAHTWPGNVRELENLIERLVNVTTSDVIDVRQLPQDIVTALVKGQDTRQGEAVMSLKRIQKALILETLRETGGNFRRTSSLLNISRTTLYAKLKQYGINAETFRTRS